LSEFRRCSWIVAHRPNRLVLEHRVDKELGPRLIQDRQNQEEWRLPDHQWLSKVALASGRSQHESQAASISEQLCPRATVYLARGRGLRLDGRSPFELERQRQVL